MIIQPLIGEHVERFVFDAHRSDDLNSAAVTRCRRQAGVRRAYRYSQKKGGQDTNMYHFTGLIKAAIPFAKEALATREQRKVEDVNRRRRKKPQLVVDNTKKTGGK